MTQTPWISIVGIGDEGLDGVTSAARALIDGAELLVGGDRHQTFVPDTTAQRLTWKDGLEAAMDEMEKWRGRRVVVLASGDPMCFGAGVNLQRRFAAEEMIVIPVPGAWSHACARMLWSMPDIELVTLHGRPLEGFNLHIAPGAKLIVLSQDGETPAKVAALLCDRGFGPSRVTVLEHMGGAKENRVNGTADAWGHDRCADLNTIAIECLPGEDAVMRPRVPGLPDEAFIHDGQLTKREVRAVTLAALGPQAGELLWDVGAGSGSIAIEWMRAARGMRALAVERDPARSATIAQNAAVLGVPKLEIVGGEAPAALANLSETPDAVFVGGGVSAEGLLEACWDRLAPGGRLVANAVTIEAEQKLLAFHDVHRGDLRRIAISHPKPAGTLTVWDQKAPVTQLAVSKL